jgi:hypothetical protein
MKTPRELLLDRHRNAESKLNAIHREVLAEFVQAEPTIESPQPAPPFSFSMLRAKVWRELILPCRHIWAGLAAAWMLILGLHLAAGTDQAPGITVNQVSKPGPEIIAAVRERRELMAQLLDPLTSLPAERPRVPGPRGSVPMTLFIG